jgi:electron transfer flavoprotein alpha/beta subunit
VNVVVCLHAPPPGPDGTRDLGREDALALAQALSLAGKGASRVTALLAGGAAETAPLERALAAGVNRAVRLAGEDLAGADFHTLGQALAGGIKRLGADLVLTGMRSDDEGLGAVPASTARQLGFVHVSAIEELTLGANDAAGGGTVDVVVRGGGRKRRLRVSLPAVLSVTAGPPTPPPAAAPAGDPTSIEVLSLVDPERTVVRRRTEFLGHPEAASRGTETVASAAALVAALARA